MCRDHRETSSIVSRVAIRGTSSSKSPMPSKFQRCREIQTSMLVSEVRGEVAYSVDSSLSNLLGPYDTWAPTHVGKWGLGPKEDLTSITNGF